MARRRRRRKNPLSPNMKLALGAGIGLAIVGALAVALGSASAAPAGGGALPPGGKTAKTTQAVPLMSGPSTTANVAAQESAGATVNVVGGIVDSSGAPPTANDAGTFDTPGAWWIEVTDANGTHGFIEARFLQ
jgi:hypothetical protein